jgi:hypothetical protein
MLAFETIEQFGSEALFFEQEDFLLEMRLIVFSQGHSESDIFRIATRSLPERT